MMLFRRFKKTEVLEKERAQLVADYKTYTEIEVSEKLKDYLSLKERIESTTFRKSRQEIESLKWKGSPEQRIELEMHQLEHNTKVKTYFSVINSENLKHYEIIAGSKLPEELDELTSYMKSGGYKSDLKSFQKKKKEINSSAIWEETDACKRKKRYNEILSSTDYQQFAKFKSSKAFKMYSEVNNSALLSRYEDLKAEFHRAV
jgi:hypothetical protein